MKVFQRKKENRMTEEKKKIDREFLEDVHGGTDAAYCVLKQDVQALFPEAVRIELANAKSDMEAMRILAANGVDLEAIQKKIADAGFGQMNTSLEKLSENALASASGGFFPINTSTDVICRCGARNKDDFTLQAFLALTSATKYALIYRCKKCGQLIGLTREGKVEFIDLSLPIGG